MRYSTISFFVLLMNIIPLHLFGMDQAAIRATRDMATLASEDKAAVSLDVSITENPSTHSPEAAISTSTSSVQTPQNTAVNNFKRTLVRFCAIFNDCTIDSDHDLPFDEKYNHIIQTVQQTWPLADDSPSQKSSKTQALAQVPLETLFALYEFCKRYDFKDIKYTTDVWNTILYHPQLLAFLIEHHNDTTFEMKFPWLTSKNYIYEFLHSKLGLPLGHLVPHKLVATIPLSHPVKNNYEEKLFALSHDGNLLAVVQDTTIQVFQYTKTIQGTTYKLVQTIDLSPQILSASKRKKYGTPHRTLSVNHDGSIMSYHISDFLAKSSTLMLCLKNNDEYTVQTHTIAGNHDFYKQSYDGSTFLTGIYLGSSIKKFFIYRLIGNELRSFEFNDQHGLFTDGALNANGDILVFIHSSAAWEKYRWNSEQQKYDLSIQAPADSQCYLGIERTPAIGINGNGNKVVLSYSQRKLYQDQYTIEPFPDERWLYLYSTLDKSYTFLGKQELPLHIKSVHNIEWSHRASIIEIRSSNGHYRHLNYCFINTSNKNDVLTLFDSSIRMPHSLSVAIAKEQEISLPSVNNGFYVPLNKKNIYYAACAFGYEKHTDSLGNVHIGTTNKDNSLVVVANDRGLATNELTVHRPDLTLLLDLSFQKLLLAAVLSEKTNPLRALQPEGWNDISACQHELPAVFDSYPPDLAQQLKALYIPAPEPLEVTSTSSVPQPTPAVVSDTQSVSSSTSTSLPIPLVATAVSPSVSTPHDVSTSVPAHIVPTITETTAPQQPPSVPQLPEAVTATTPNSTLNHPAPTAESEQKEQSQKMYLQEQMLPIRKPDVVPQRTATSSQTTSINSSTLNQNTLWQFVQQYRTPLVLLGSLGIGALGAKRWFNKNKRPVVQKIAHTGLS